MRSLEQSVKMLQHGAKMVQTDFTEPDDDWIGVLLLESDSGRGLMPLHFNSDREKDYLTNFQIPDMIRMLRPWLVGMVLSAWLVEVPNAGVEMRPEGPPLTYDEIGMDVRPSHHPDRVECLILTAYTAEQTQMWRAKIVRYPKRPPTLKRWELLNDTTHMEGRFVTPIVEALKEVNDE